MVHPEIDEDLVELRLGVHGAKDPGARQLVQNPLRPGGGRDQVVHEAIHLFRRVAGLCLRRRPSQLFRYPAGVLDRALEAHHELGIRHPRRWEGRHLLRYARIRKPLRVQLLLDVGRNAQREHPFEVARRRSEAQPVQHMQRFLAIQELARVGRGSRPSRCGREGRREQERHDRQRSQPHEKGYDAAA